MEDKEYMRKAVQFFKRPQFGIVFFFYVLFTIFILKS